MATLVVNVGNTSLFCGVFAAERAPRVFRLAVDASVRLPARVRGRIERAAVSSVVPGLTPAVLRLIRRTWAVEPAVLTATAAHGLKIGYRMPGQLGADRVAAALGARTLYPRRHVIVVDCGTATTVTALRADGTVAGGAIFPGLKLAAESLARGTAQLPAANVHRPRAALGRSPREGIASGCYFGQLGAIKEVVARVRREAFGRAAAVVLGTGGGAAAFEREGIFEAVVPDLVLRGLAFFAGRGGGRPPEPS